MSTVRRRLDPANPPRLSAATKARLDARSSDEIEAAAVADPDNPPLSDEELDRARLSQEVRRIRLRTGLSQSKFAAAYSINPARLRDWEQGRFMPDTVALAYLKVIAAEPQLVAKILGEAPDDRAA